MDRPASCLFNTTYLLAIGFYGAQAVITIGVQYLYSFVYTLPSSLEGRRTQGSLPSGETFENKYLFIHATLTMWDDADAKMQIDREIAIVFLIYFLYLCI